MLHLDVCSFVSALRHSLLSWRGLPLCALWAANRCSSLSSSAGLLLNSLPSTSSWAQPPSCRHRGLCGLHLAWRKPKSLLWFSTHFRWKYTLSSTRDVPPLEPSCLLATRIIQGLLLGTQGSRRTHNKRTQEWLRHPTCSFLHQLPSTSSSFVCFWMW